MARLQLSTIAAALLFGTATLAIAQSQTTTDPSGDHDTNAGVATSPPMTSSEIKTKLENAGYTQVREVKSTAEGFSAKAMKQGKEVSLTIDSSGQVREKPAAE
jgi:hypothetical protein